VGYVTHSRRADREQIESDWWFGRLHGQLARLIEWADDAEWPAHYELTDKARLLLGQVQDERGIWWVCEELEF